MKIEGQEGVRTRVVIQAPLIRANTSPPAAVPPTPSELAGTMIRHLKGVLGAAEELKAHLEREESK